MSTHLQVLHKMLTAAAETFLDIPSEAFGRADVGCRELLSKNSTGMRDEVLNESLFLGLDHCPEQDHEITNWIDDYNQRRRHSVLGYLTPVAYAANLWGQNREMQFPIGR